MWKTNSPVEPTHHITSVGLSGDRKKFACAPKLFFQPTTFGNLDDCGIKSSSKELKFWGDEDDDFKNTSPKYFNESPHGLRGIGRNRSKSGVFSRTQKLRFVETRRYDNTLLQHNHQYDIKKFTGTQSYVLQMKVVTHSVCFEKYVTNNCYKNMLLTAAIVTQN